MIDDKSAARPHSSTVSRFRTDIEGLRAVAVLLVVLFHAGVPFLPGGYVGVDVFFVISGFLITGLLIREVKTTGKLSITRFYMRRVRRILPMSTLVLIVTVVLAALWMTEAESRAASAAASAAAVFIANWYFASSSTDYFDSTTHTNPILHYWSLGVEEQFYVIWPLLLIAVIVISKLAGLTIRSIVIIAGIALVVLCAASLWWSVTQSSQEGQWAFFGLHTRLWEMGFGGLLAIFAPRLTRLPRVLYQFIGLFGLALIAYAAVSFSESTVFPGAAALLPVVGSILVISSGLSSVGNPTVAGRLLSTRLMNYVGARSYNLYLWHWPVLVFAAMWSNPRAFGAASSWHLTMPFWVATLAICIAFGLTVVTFKTIEQPLRSANFMKKKASTFTSAAIMILSVLVIAGLITPILRTNIAHGSPESQSLVDQARIASTEIKSDEFWVERDPCIGRVKERPERAISRWSNEACTYGDPNGKIHIALVGDSHADMWLPAFDKIGKSKGWKVTVMTRSSCSILSMSSPEMDQGSDAIGCHEWASLAFDELKKYGPYDAVVVGRSQAHFPYQVFPGMEPDEVKAVRDRAVGHTRDALEALGTITPQVVILGEPAFAFFDMSACIERSRGETDQCTFDRDKGLRIESQLVLQEEAAIAGLDGNPDVHYLPISDILCPPTDSGQCPAVIDGNYLTSRDGSHVPIRTSRHLADEVQKMIEDRVVLNSSQ